MTQNTDFLIQALEKIGAPLAIAVEDVSSRLRKDMDSAEREIEDAKIIAQLLGQTVQISLSMSSLLIKEDRSEEEADMLRLSLASIAGPLVAGFYRLQGRTPEDNDIKRISKSMEAVLAFAENFNPASASRTRLKMLGEDSLVFDTEQVQITVLNALIPVINAIGEFSFGHSEPKLLQDVSEKIRKKSKIMASPGDQLSELMILKALAGIYAECHRKETARLAKENNEDRDSLSLDPVWDAFETRLAMVEAVLMPSDQSQLAQEGSVSDSSVAPVADKEIVQDVSVQAPVDQATTVPEVVPVAGDTGNPMSFFTGGKAEDQAPNVSAEQPASQAVQETSPPQVQTPVTPASGESDIPNQASGQPPNTDTASSSSAEPVKSSPTDSSNPMSFFKPGQQSGEADKNQESQ